MCRSPRPSSHPPTFPGLPRSPGTLSWGLCAAQLSRELCEVIWGGRLQAQGFPEDVIDPGLLDGLRGLRLRERGVVEPWSAHRGQDPWHRGVRKQVHEVGDGHEVEDLWAHAGLEDPPCMVGRELGE